MKNPEGCATDQKGLDAMTEIVLRASLLGFAGSMPVSIAFCQISLGIGWLAWLAKCWHYRRWLGHALGLELPLGLFMAVCILSTIFSPRPVESLIGLKKFYLASAMLLTAYAIRRPDDIRRMLAFFLSFSAITGAYGLLMHLFGFQARLTGTQTMALTAGGIYLMAGLISMALAVEGRLFPRWLSLGGTVLFAADIFFTQSAGSLIAFAAASAVILAISRRGKLLAAAAVIMVAVAAAFLSLPAGKGSTVETQKVNTWQLRKTIWTVGWKVVAERPIIGHGLVDLGDAYRRNRERWDLERDPWGAWNYGHLHNNFLQVTAMSGFVGLVAFLFLLYSVLRTGLKAYGGASPTEKAVALAASGAIVGFIINGLTEWNFGDSEVVTIFWFVAGISASLQGRHLNEGR